MRWTPSCATVIQAFISARFITTQPLKVGKSDLEGSWRCAGKGESMPKILLVDDDKEKIRRVLSIVQRVPGINSQDVTVPYPVFDAMQLLRHHAQYTPYFLFV